MVDKIEQFTGELSDPRTDPEERLVALKFVLHLVGDLHQPLHAADDHDAGGNRKRVVAAGFRPDNLHHFWDTEWVQRLGTDPRQVADALTGAISDQQRQAWSRGTLSDWVMESFAVACKDAYGLLPEPSTKGVYVLDAGYAEAAIRDVPVAAMPGWRQACRGAQQDALARAMNENLPFFVHRHRRGGASPPPLRNVRRFRACRRMPPGLAGWVTPGISYGWCTAR